MNPFHSFAVWGIGIAVGTVAAFDQIHTGGLALDQILAMIQN